VLNIHEPLLVNAIGHSAGAVIFGIFLFLFLKDRGSSRFLRGSWLSFGAGGLALGAALLYLKLGHYLSIG
jgi:hypothetical protein